MDNMPLRVEQYGDQWAVLGGGLAAPGAWAVHSTRDAAMADAEQLAEEMFLELKR